MHHPKPFLPDFGLTNYHTVQPLEQSNPSSSFMKAISTSVLAASQIPVERQYKSKQSTFHDEFQDSMSRLIMTPASFDFGQQLSFVELSTLSEVKPTRTPVKKKSMSTYKTSNSKNDIAQAICETVPPRLEDLMKVVLSSAGNSTVMNPVQPSRNETAEVAIAADTPLRKKSKKKPKGSSTRSRISKAKTIADPTCASLSVNSSAQTNAVAVAPDSSSMPTNRMFDITFRDLDECFLEYTVETSDVLGIWGTAVGSEHDNSTHSGSPELCFSMLDACP